MSITRWLETDSQTNINIAAATAVGAYTADADRMILCDVTANQIVGGGDYLVYLTRQIAGSGPHFAVLPAPPITVPTGVTAFSVQSQIITVRAGDVITVYIDGLAGDTTTPDTSVRWFEMSGAAVQLAATQGAVTFNGQVRIEANVANQGALHIQNTHGLGSGIYADGGMNGQYNSGANGSGVINTGASAGTYNYGPIGLLNEGTQTGQRNLGAVNNSLGTLDPTTAAAVWSYVLRVLTTMPAVVEVVPATGTGELRIVAGVTYAAQLTNVTYPANWKTAYLTIKRTRKHADADAVLQMIISNPTEAGDGVIVVTGRQAVDNEPTWGTLTPDDVLGTMHVYIADDLTTLLGAREGLVWDLKLIDAAGDSTVPTGGTADIVQAVTRQI